MIESAHFLVGPTASGKTDAAHIIARRNNMAILSIDSMLVYRGMDIGTAKPSLHSRAGIRYYGIDIVEPCCEFSLGRFCEYSRTVLKESDRDLIVCGGSGLYAKALAAGFEDGDGPEAELRLKYERLYTEHGLAALKLELGDLSPEALRGLKDPENPRRLIRALEIAASGRSPGRSASWKEKPVFAGIELSPEVLAARIDRRVDQMFAGGFTEEVKSLISGDRPLSRSARQAIGYAEVIAYFDGRMSLADARERTKVRTRQLAKKQRTWFRHQANIDWVRADGLAPEDIAGKVEKIWEKNGKTRFGIGGQEKV